MSAEHDLPERFILEWMRKYEDKIQAIEELNANGIVDERKRNASIFSDAQTDRVESIVARAILALLGSDAFSKAVTKEVTFIAGSQSLHLWVYMGGAFIAGCTTILI